jgi:3-dehydroquinate synthase
MVRASRLSVIASGLSTTDAERLVSLVRRARLPVDPPQLALSEWLESMGRDKKVERGAMRFVVLEELGRAVLRNDIATQQVIESVTV